MENLHTQTTAAQIEKKETKHDRFEFRNGPSSMEIDKKSNNFLKQYRVDISISLDFSI